MSLLPPKAEGSTSPSNTLGHDSSTLSAGGKDQTDGSGLFNWSFTLRGHKGEQEEVRALDEATHQALAPRTKPMGHFIEPDSGRTHWKVLAHEAMDAEEAVALCASIVEWINDTLANRRIIVKDLREDIYDGQVLVDLADELTGGTDTGKPSVIALSEKSQLDRLKKVLEVFNDILRVNEAEAAWSPRAIHACDMVATLKLLVAVIHHFSPKTVLPPGVTLEVMEIERTSNGMSAKTVEEHITAGRSKRVTTDGRSEYQPDDDVFDKLFNEAPEKVDAVKVVLTKFANNHLNKVAVTITEPGKDMRSGVAMVMMLQLVGGYFIPLRDYSVNPSTKDEFLHNNGLVIRLMQEQNIITSSCPVTPDDLVNGDLKSIFRLVYAIFRMEKHRAQQRAAAANTTVSRASVSSQHITSPSHRAAAAPHTESASFEHSVV